MIKHLTKINDLTPSEIFHLLDLTHFYSLNFHRRAFNTCLDSKLVANLFFENSTRTRYSFEVAQKMLGAKVLNFDEVTSSAAKGEALADTLKTFEALQIQLAVIRHSDDNYIESLKENSPFSIINAGAGKKEHPSQCLLDLFTIYEEFQKLEGLTVTIVGDIVNSRVAASHRSIMSKLDINLQYCGPKEFLPQQKDSQNVSWDEALTSSDVIMLLRIQHERHGNEYNIENYNSLWGMNENRRKKMRPSAIIMHPGPFNRGVEITSECVHGEQSRIFKQMQNGVYTRMAILDWIFKG